MTVETAQPISGCESHAGRGVGETPLVEVDGIFAKLECCNPCGSIKDRIAQFILDESERKGLLRPGMTVVEATSGNTGIALSYYARQKGYRVKIIMPEHMTEERKEWIRKLGAELVLCSMEGGFKEAAEIRDEIARDPNYFNPDQFSNPLNVDCHYQTTGKEIADEMSARNRRIDAFVAGVGTGGTLIGVGKRLRERNGEVFLAAVEPEESAVMSGGEWGPHGIPGIGDGFIPAIVQGEKNGLHAMIGEVIRIGSEEAKRAAKRLADEFGYCVGISSGANFLAAKKLMERFPTVVTIFADGYNRYESEGLHRLEGPHCPSGR